MAARVRNDGAKGGPVFDENKPTGKQLFLSNLAGEEAGNTSTEAGEEVEVREDLFDDGDEFDDLDDEDFEDDEDDDDDSDYGDIDGEEKA